MRLSGYAKRWGAPEVRKLQICLEQWNFNMEEMVNPDLQVSNQ